MPVFLFALSQANTVNWYKSTLAFVILHLIIFPSINGYNSYQDRDETSIGGLKYPPKVSRKLFFATLLMDIAGLFFAFFVSALFSLFVLITVLVSRAYSYRNVRLKKYPVIGFLTVFVFQGGFVFMMASAAIKPFQLPDFFTLNNVLCMSVASLFMGSVYPLTQIYQHEADLKDGVTSLSYKLGYTGSFVFSAMLFLLATTIMSWYFKLKHQPTAVLLFFVLMLPVVAYLLIWFYRVRKNTANANYENTMTMNRLTSVCMNLYFLVLILNNHFLWF